jgi:hypothetical protein
MKYMLMMFGDAATMMETRTPEWVSDMMAFMGRFNAEVEKTGELVEARGLDDPSSAKTVSLVDGQVVVSDGPFAEAKESLAGFWVFEVENEARAVELASQVVVWADRVELRQVPDGPPEQ